MRGSLLPAAAICAFSLPVSAASLPRWAMLAATPEAIAGAAFELEIQTDGDVEAETSHVRVVRTQHLLKRAAAGSQGEMTVVTTAADSRACPALHRRMLALRAAEAAQLKAPAPSHSTLDGTDIIIDAPLLGGRPGQRITLEQTESMQAIQSWIYDTVKALKPCWKPAPPL